MFDSEAHLPLFEALMGLRGHRPLECIGGWGGWVGGWGSGGNLGVGGSGWG